MGIWRCRTRMLQHPGWKKNDIISINLDFNHLKVSFFVNDKLIGSSMDLDNTLTYHLALAAQNHDCEYEIL